MKNLILDYTSNEYTVAQAALIADATGYMLKHPFIQHHLQRVLMKWAYRLCTSGGFRLPGFALADDGYLFLHEGQVVCSSDWIPKTSAIAESSCRRGLVVRYPIRMKKHLLPAEILSVEDTVRLLARQLEQRGCQLSAEGVAAVAREQLQLRGTLVLHLKPLPETAVTLTSTWCAWSRTTVFHGSSQTGSHTKNNTLPSRPRTPSLRVHGGTFRRFPCRPAEIRSAL